MLTLPNGNSTRIPNSELVASSRSVSLRLTRPLVADGETAILPGDDSSQWDVDSSGFAMRASGTLCA